MSVCGHASNFVEFVQPVWMEHRLVSALVGGTMLSAQTHQHANVSWAELYPGSLSLS